MDTKQQKKILKINYIPIIIITARCLFGTKEESTLYDCLDFISKPCSIDDLKNVLINNNLLN